MPQKRHEQELRVVPNDLKKEEKVEEAQPLFQVDYLREQAALEQPQLPLRGVAVAAQPLREFVETRKQLLPRRV